MQKESSPKTIKPYLAVCIALLAVVVQIVAAYGVIQIEFPWHILLWVVVVIALLVVFGQIFHAEKDNKIQAEQLFSSKERLANEIKHRFWAEKTISESKVRLQFVDENIPVMLAYFNLDQRCRYHNRIFRRWFGLKPDQIDGQLFKDFSTEAFYADIEQCITEAVAGKTVYNERVLKSEKGVAYQFVEQFVPHLDVRKKVIGFYSVHTPVVQDKKVSAASNNSPTRSATDSVQVNNVVPDNEVVEAQAGISSARIAKAIDDGEFHLFCQKIAPIKSGPIHYEVLIRMAEEENNLMPPGAFLPFVEKYKMMPRLDRWVVNYMAQWLANHQTQPESIFCINVARDTLCDADFPQFVRDQIQAAKISAATICFEIEELDVDLERTNALAFAEKISEVGCLISLCSFSHSRTSLELLKKTKIHYVKIDGSLVCNMLREQEDLSKIVAINHIAHSRGVQTIAELVESKETVEKLGEIGVDYSQGFVIAKPHELKELENV